MTRPNEKEYPEGLYKIKSMQCPLTECDIPMEDCVIVQVASKGLIAESEISETFKLKQNWKNICLDCPFHKRFDNMNPKPIQPPEGDFVCPITRKKIDCGECIENQDVVDDIINEASMPKEYTSVIGWKEICRRCPYREIE